MEGGGGGGGVVQIKGWIVMIKINHKTRYRDTAYSMAQADVERRSYCVGYEVWIFTYFGEYWIE